MDAGPRSDLTAIGPDEPQPRRARAGRRWAALAVAAALAVGAVVVAGTGKDGGPSVAVQAGSRGGDHAAAIGEVPDGAGAPDETTTTTGADASTSSTSAPAGGAHQKGSPALTSTTRSTAVGPASTTTTAPAGMVPPFTPPPTSPCPAPPFPARTISTPGYWLVPVDGGAPRPVLTDAGLHPHEVVASPDGRRLVFSDFDPTSNNGQDPFKVYTVAADGTGLTPVDTGTTHPFGFAWSPDGRWIAFHDQSSTGSAVTGVWLMAPDGSQRRRLFQYPVPGSGWLRWSPDGTHLAASSANTGAGAGAIDVASGTSVQLATEAVWEVDWSPDSKRLVVDITDGSPPSPTGSTTRQILPIVVVNADGTGRKELVKEGVWAVWSPLGDGIAVRSSATFINPDTLAQGRYGPGSALAYAPDGHHLLATGPGLLIDDGHGCGDQLLTTDGRGSPVFDNWAGNEQILVHVLPPA